MSRRRKNYDEDLMKFLRATLIPRWRRDSIEDSDGKCVITGEEFEVVHHPYPYNLIIRETLENLNMPKFKRINEYEESDLLQIKEEFIRLHYHYGLGICLTDEIHREFHNLMGLNAKPEDFEIYKHYKLNNLDLNEITKCDINNKYTEEKEIKIYIDELKYILDNLDKNFNEMIVMFSLLILCRKYGNKENKFFASGDIIKEYVHFERATVYRKLKILDEKGFITKISRGDIHKESDNNYIRLPNEYKLDFLNNITYENKSNFIVVDLTTNIDDIYFTNILSDNLSKKYLKKTLPDRRYRDISKRYNLFRKGIKI